MSVVASVRCGASGEAPGVAPLLTPPCIAFVGDASGVYGDITHVAGLWGDTPSTLVLMPSQHLSAAGLPLAPALAAHRCTYAALDVEYAMPPKRVRSSPLLLCCCVRCHNRVLNPPQLGGLINSVKAGSVIVNGPSVATGVACPVTVLAMPP